MSRWGTRVATTLVLACNVVVATPLVASATVVGGHLSVVTTSAQSTISEVGQVLNLSVQVSNDGSLDVSALTLSSTPSLTDISCPSTSLTSGSAETCTANYAVQQADLNAGSTSVSFTANATLPDLSPVSSAASRVTVPISSQVTTIRGIDVLVGSSLAQQPKYELSKAKETFTYIKSLGANAISLNFVFYNVGQTLTNGAQSANAVTSGPQTPSPQLIAEITQIAVSMGLRVQIRPLLSQDGDTPLQWHGTITPTNPAAWIQSYQKWLDPYVELSRLAGASDFCVAAELNSMLKYTQLWAQFVHHFRQEFGANVFYAQSRFISTQPQHYLTMPGTKIGYDAYNPVVPPAGTTVTSANATSIFTTGINANFHPAGFMAPLDETTIEETGLAAVNNAWIWPPQSSQPAGTPLIRWVQADWFTATCNVVQANRMPGVYFWFVNMDIFSPSYNANVANDYIRWQGTQAETAIKNCFASLP